MSATDVLSPLPSDRGGAAPEADQDKERTDGAGELCGEGTALVSSCSGLREGMLVLVQALAFLSGVLKWARPT